MRVWRVIDGVVFGGEGGRWTGPTPSLAVGDEVRNVFATTSRAAVVAMLQWCEEFAEFEFGGGSWAAVAEIETTDFTTAIAPEWRNGPFNPKTDTGEVFVFSGRVVAVDPHPTKTWLTQGGKK